MKNIVLILFIIITYTLSSQTVTIASLGAQTGTGFDMASVWSSIKTGANTNDTITLVPGAIYNFDNKVDFENVNNIVFIAPGGASNRAVFFSDNLSTIFESHQSASNLEFVNIKFESTANTLVNGNNNAESIVFFYGYAGYTINWNNHKWLNCEFTAPNCQTNGVKYYTPDLVRVNGIEIRDCWFHDLGRMGFETVNHSSPLVSRVTNVYFINNIVSNTGVVNYGMGISLSGRNEFCRIIGNDFDNNPATAIEIIGNKNVTIANNTMDGTGSDIHLVNGAGVTNDSMSIYNNVSNTQYAIWMIDATNIYLWNNQRTFNTKIYLAGVQNIYFENESIIGNDGSIGVIQMNNPPGSSNTTPNANVNFNKCIITNNFNSPIFNSGTAINSSCNDIYAQSAGNYYGVNNTDVDLYVGGVYNQTFNSTSNPCGTKGYGGSTPPNPCANDIANEYTTINLSSATSVSGLDNITGTQSNVNGSPCAIELHNNDSNEPWARIEKSINLASNGLVAGDLIEVRIDGNNNTGVARIEIAQNNTSNTAVSLHNFTGTGWQTYVDTFAVPTGITTLDLWLYSNFNSNNPGVTYYDNLHLRIVDTTNCPNFLENEDFVIVLPQGNLTAGGDSVIGTSLITNGSTCAIEVHNGDNNEPWARYHIPLVLSNYGINTGDMIEFSLDGNNYNGAARVEVVEDNTPNTAITSHDYTATGWQTYSDTLIVPSGITSLDIWIYSNYNNNTPGVALYDNLVVKKLNTTNTKEITSTNIKVYPNPATDKINIEGLAQGENYSLYSSEGRLILNDNKPQIELSTLSKGIYILKLKYKQIKIIKK